MAEKVDLSKQTNAGAIKGAANQINADKAKTLVGGALANAFAGAKGNVKELLNGLKQSLGLPDIPKIPKKPAFPAPKKFKPKPQPQAPIYQKEEKKFDYAKAEPVKPIQTKPAPVFPAGNPYKYTFEKSGGKWAISVDVYGNPVGRLAFQGNVTEEYAKQSFINSYKADNPGIEGMTKA